MHPLTRRLARTINRTDGVNGVPFTAPVAMTPRVREKWASWVHYGVMAPGLPDPHRWFGVMAILGTSGAACFDDDARMVSTPRDTAYLVAGTAVDGAATSYSMARDCAFAEDGSSLRFGSDLTFDGAPPHVRVERGDVSLALEVTDKVAYFSRLPGVYDHFSLLASYTGTIAGEAVSGLCTWEYARGAGPYTVARKPVPAFLRAPLKSFTYQVLNLDEETQLLLTTAGPARGRSVHEGAWERGLSWHGGMHRDVTYVVERDRAELLITPDGRSMTLPAAWTWTVRDRGVELASLRGVASDDWVYGLGAGYVGSFAYEGTYRGRAVGGLAYVEAVEV